MHRQGWISPCIARTAIGVNRAGAATSGRSSSQAGTGRITAHREFGMVWIFVIGVIGVILLLVGIGHVGHALHVCELAVRCTGIAQRASLRLDLALGINVLVPIPHGVFVYITDHKIVDDTRITFPENLNTIKSCLNELEMPHTRKRPSAVLTRLLKTNDIRNVGHVDATLQLETGLSFRVQ